MNANVLACVVTYNSDLGKLALVLKAGLEQCDIVVVDNGSANVDEVERLVDGMTNVDICKLNSNMGLGAAHNQGFQLADEKNKDYLLILDDDSIVDPDLVGALVSAHKEKTASGINVSAIGSSYRYGTQTDPVFVRFSATKLQRVGIESADSHGCISCDFLISSGSLINLNCYKQIGGMDESLFIDHVDTEWFLRARKQGYQAFGTVNGFMSHDLGEDSHQIRLGNRVRNIPQHSPFRYYYIFRNSVLLYKRSYVPWLWRWNDIQRLGFILLMYSLFKGPRWQNLKMMMAGLWDGVLGRSGPRKC